MRRRRKCVPSRGMHSTAFSNASSRRLFRNPLQNRAELLVSVVAAVVAETVFVKVALQVFRRNGVIDTADPALYKTPKTLDAVGMNVAIPHILSRFVPDAMVSETERATAWPLHLGNQPIKVEVIGINHAAWYNVLADSAKQVLAGNVVNHSCDCFPAALYDCDHRSLFLVSAHRATALPLADTTIVRFVNFHRWPLQFEVAVGHEAANLPEHAPCGFVGDASFALDLLCGDTAAGRPHEKRGIEPQPERGRGLLKDGSRERVDVMPTMVARIGGTATHAVVLALDAALAALSHAAWIPLLFDVLKASVVVRKLFVEVPHGVAECFRYALFNFHRSLTNQFYDRRLLVVKG